MLKKLGIGALCALAVATFVAGCSSKKKTFSQGSTTELPGDQFPGSAIAQSNLAQDGGGYSNNNQAATAYQVKVTFNNRAQGDASSSADGSAMVLFSTVENGTSFQRVYASYWSGSAFTPPTELTGQDRNESIVTDGGFGTNFGIVVHVQAAVLIPLNTQNYKSPGTASGGADQVVRSNAGNWILLWDAQTATTAPALVIPDRIDNSLGAADANGTHHTFYATVFLKSLAGQASATSELVGNTATSGPAVSPLAAQSKVFHYGFQAVGIEVPGTGIATPGSTNRGGPSPDYTTQTGSGQLFAGKTFVDKTVTKRLAEDVVSFGAATDTFVGAATFSEYGFEELALVGLALDPTGLVPFVIGADATTGLTKVVAGSPDPTDDDGTPPVVSTYTCGDDTSFVQLFWTQLVTSHAGANTGSFQSGSMERHMGAGYRFFTANLDLASMTVKNQKTVAFTATRNPATGPTFGSTQALPGFLTYNNTVFWRYDDASLATAATNALDVGNLVDSDGFRTNTSQCVAVLTVKPGVNGSADIDQAGQYDVTRHGTGGKHSTLNRSAPGTNGGSEPGDEVVQFPAETFTLVGPDEGMADLSVFLLGRATTNTARNDMDTDRQLWCLALDPATGTPIAAGTGGNPRLVSKHQTEPFTGAGYVPGASGGIDSNLHDDVGDVKLATARDGTYVVIGYRQAQGASSLAQSVGLLATVYKPLRAATATVNTGSGSTAVTTTLDQRFPTTAPIQVNTPSVTAFASNATDAQGINAIAGFTGSPVTLWDFQGTTAITVSFGSAASSVQQIARFETRTYRRAFQSAPSKLSVFWSHTDGTEDRVFARQLSIDLGASTTANPTLTTTAPESELETGNLVKGAGAYTSFGTPTNDGTIRIPGSQYRFLPFGFSFFVSKLDSAGNGTHLPTEQNPYRALLVSGATSFFDFRSSFGLIRNQRLLTIDAGSSGNAGDVLVVFSKVTDATTSDGDFFDQQVIGVRYTGTSVADRVVLSSNLKENRNDVRDLRTNVATLIGTPRSASLTPAALKTAGGAYVLMTVPRNDSGLSPSAVVARHFRPLSGVGTAPLFADQFFPAAGATTTAGGFLEPLQISRELNSDAFINETFTDGRRLLVTMTQDNHVWGSLTSDGESYTSKGGIAAPFLVDDNLSTNASPMSGFSIQEASGRRLTTNGDDLVGTILAVCKRDVNQNPRLYIRILR